MFPYDVLHVMNICAKGKQSLTIMILVLGLYKCNFQKFNTKLIEREQVKYWPRNLKRLIGFLEMKDDSKIYYNTCKLILASNKVEEQ